jgi:hypothetical protein
MVPAPMTPMREILPDMKARLRLNAPPAIAGHRHFVGH